MKKYYQYIIALAVILGLTYFIRWTFVEPDFVIRQGGRVYIVDATGQRWEVSQAESLGLPPRHFGHGLGRDAFTPLDDSALSPDASSIKDGTRVIGISAGDEAKAFPVDRLKKHEVANSTLGGRPVAVGY